MRSRRRRQAILPVEISQTCARLRYAAPSSPHGGDRKESGQFPALPDSTMNTAVTIDPSLPHLRRYGDSIAMVALLMAAGLSVLLGWQQAQMTLAMTGVLVLVGPAVLLYAIARGSWSNSVALPVLLMGVVALNIQLG